MKFQRFGRFSAVAMVGALALAGCGSDDNAEETPATGGNAPSTGSSTAASAPAPAAGDITCPTGGGTLSGAGSSAQANAVTEWSKAFQAACSGVTINYQGSGSGAGRQSFIDGQVAWAGSDSAIKEDEKTKADAKCAGGEAVNLPMVVGPIAVAYNLEGVDNLQLSAKTVAGIFAGKITKWDAPEIKADNPDAKLPSDKINAVHRADKSGTTGNFAKYLSAAAADVWTLGTEEVWPGAAGGQGANKSAGVADAVAQASGSIGYVEYSYVDSAGLKAAKIANDGKTFIELTPENAAAAVADAEIAGTGKDLTLKLNYATTAANAYPIVLVTYEIACTAGAPADQAALVKSFLTYTSSTAGQSVLTANGYAPLPDAIRTKVADTVSALAAG